MTSPSQKRGSLPSGKLHDDPLTPKRRSVRKMTVSHRKELKTAISTLDTTIKQTLKSLGDIGNAQESCPVPGKDITREEKVEVYARAVFLKVGEIDTVNERFTADAFVQARWREPMLDGEAKDMEFEMKDWSYRENFWDPRLYIENVLGELKESIWYVKSFNEDGEATIYQRRRIKGTFFERMELNQFPFDTQDLTLTVTTERGEVELDLSPDDSEISTVNIQSFVDEQEWHLHKHINTWKKVTTNLYKSSNNKHPAVSISCTATRRAPFFLWNIILVMMFICTLIFTTFTVDQDLPQNRIQLSFILLLSNITFKFTVNQTLPKVSYLTYLDKYILISMAILCLVCVWHAIVSQLWVRVGEDFAKNADLVAFALLVVIYVMFNVIFFAYTNSMVSKRSKLYREKDQSQRDKLQEIEMEAQGATPGIIGNTKVSPDASNHKDGTL